MLLVQEILISEAIIEEQFICNLKACKGACCWEGDYGAPLDADELPVLESIYEAIVPFLSAEGQQALDEQGLYVFNEQAKVYETPLVEGGACAYMIINELGVAKCAIESANLAGATDFKKPISCHLYPIRVKENHQSGFKALNYDKWEICSAACTLGEENQVAVYQFVKDAIIRKFGEDFFQELDRMAQYLKSEE